MFYKQDISMCFPRGIDKNVFEQLFSRADKLAKIILTSPPFNNIEKKSKIDELIPIADRVVRNFNHLVVFGTGASTICPQTLTSLQKNTSIKIHYADYTDPADSIELIESIKPKDTCFLVISKSGRTLETLAQLLWAINYLKEAGLNNIGQHFIMISDPVDSPLRKIAQDIGSVVIDHEKDVGGRYSIFTNVGLLPALIMGADYEQIYQGIKSVTNNLSIPAQGAALAVTMLEHGLSNAVFMPYVRKLIPLNVLFRQLYAESLGKNGGGITPITALGTIDQHSQLQLYLDGKKDKWFTLVTFDTSGQGGRILSHNACRHLNEHALGDVQNASQLATLQTLAANQLPVRAIHLEELGIRSLSALVTHLMIETVIIAQMIGVNPFDQPAVEAGKIKTIELLVKQK